MKLPRIAVSFTFSTPAPMFSVLVNIVHYAIPGVWK